MAPPHFWYPTGGTDASDPVYAGQGVTRPRKAVHLGEGSTIFPEEFTLIIYVLALKGMFINTKLS